MADQDFDQTEEATPHKLREARKKGSVAKSSDFSTLAILATMAACVYAIGWNMLGGTLAIQRKVFSAPVRLAWTPDGIAHWLGSLLVDSLSVLGPLMMAVLVTGIAVNLFQSGPVFSMQALSPDLNRLNPATGFKRIFSMRTLFESGKSMVKLIVLGAVMITLVYDALPGLLGLPMVDTRNYPRILMGLVGAILAKMVLAYLVIALSDLVFTRYEFAKRMRMSKREVKDEHKNREGDPRIRSRIRELRKEMLKRSKSMAKVKEADVLLTNPTHLAVALSYSHGTSAAPQVIAKGAGGLAQSMRKVASRHQIPIVQNKALARALFREVDYEGYVPEKHYAQVAKIMVWVYAMRKTRGATGKAAQ